MLKIFDSVARVNIAADMLPMISDWKSYPHDAAVKDLMINEKLNLDLEQNF